MSRVAHLCLRSLMESVLELPLFTKFLLTRILIVPGGLPGFPYLGLSESRWVCVGRLGMSVSEERLPRSPASTHPRNHITLQIRGKTHTSRIPKSNHAPRVAEESIKLARNIAYTPRVSNYKQWPTLSKLRFEAKTHHKDPDADCGSQKREVRSGKYHPTLFPQ